MTRRYRLQSKKLCSQKKKKLLECFARCQEEKKYSKELQREEEKKELYDIFMWKMKKRTRSEFLISHYSIDFKHQTKENTHREDIRRHFNINTHLKIFFYSLTLSLDLI